MLNYPELVQVVPCQLFRSFIFGERWVKWCMPMAGIYPWTLVSVQDQAAGQLEGRTCRSFSMIVEARSGFGGEPALLTEHTPLSVNAQWGC